ncbi:hypothetical protein RIF29_42133 [Crotalaria pallida]|uniref:Uncharacterized protein n=1 Tax=Crotalaria pallida TaxID=3830 RepID=A0AAN9E6T2_CROPI
MAMLMEEYSLQVVDSVRTMKMAIVRGEVKYPIKGINLLKAHKKSARYNFMPKEWLLGLSLQKLLVLISIFRG